MNILTHSGCAERIRSAYDVCDLSPSNPKPGYHDLHGGSCDFEQMWTFMDQEVTTFDKKVLWVQRPLLRKKSPQLTGLDDTSIDAMSIKTSSSENSFTKFQALALRLRFRGSTSSLRSQESNWSGLSADSWRLHNIMEIEELPSESMITNQEREEQGKIEFA